ncbi:ankyrin repeat domain-containing protein [Brachyspira pilosicoli]|uniref:ankyrin repeat domain-containing protein n=1 Tax=Brachyspira pilosicoli TaxID=52584 RepID=UPI001C679FF3|nr:ankyrin repeat domain-containing protein [Brachyspira pilosicoli]MBW5392292.1 ankyrin repeat domain-containing protein [Brachyspira pilosicoli]
MIELLEASKNNDLETLKALIEKGADVNIQHDVMGETALMSASKNGHYNIVKYLIDKGAKIDIKDNGYQRL